MVWSDFERLLFFFFFLSFFFFLGDESLTRLVALTKSSVLMGVVKGRVGEVPMGPVVVESLVLMGEVPAESSVLMGVVKGRVGVVSTLPSGSVLMLGATINSAVSVVPMASAPPVVVVVEMIAVEVEEEAVDFSGVVLLWVGDNSVADVGWFGEG